MPTVRNIYPNFLEARVLGALPAALLVLAAVLEGVNELYDPGDLLPTVLVNVVVGFLLHGGVVGFARASCFFSSEVEGVGWSRKDSYCRSLPVTHWWSSSHC